MKLKDEWLLLLVKLGKYLLSKNKFLCNSHSCSKKKTKFKIIVCQPKRENQKILTFILHCLWSHINSGAHCFENNGVAEFQDISHKICYCFLPIGGPILHVVKNNLALLVFMFYFFISTEAKNNLLWAWTFSPVYYLFPFVSVCLFWFG